MPLSHLSQDSDIERADKYAENAISIDHYNPHGEHYIQELILLCHNYDHNSRVLSQLSLMQGWSTKEAACTSLVTTKKLQSTSRKLWHGSHVP